MAERGADIVCIGNLTIDEAVQPDGRRVEALEVTANGAVEVAFSDGTLLAVAPHPREEAWQLQGAGGLEGLVYRCPAGGGRPWASARG